jgi:hypothetical protein
VFLVRGFGYQSIRIQGYVRNSNVFTCKHHNRQVIRRYSLFIHDSKTAINPLKPRLLTISNNIPTTPFLTFWLKTKGKKLRKRKREGTCESRSENVCNDIGIFLIRQWCSGPLRLRHAERSRRLSGIRGCGGRGGGDGVWWDVLGMFAKEWLRP